MSPVISSRFSAVPFCHFSWIRVIGSILLCCAKPISLLVTSVCVFVCLSVRAKLKNYESENDRNLAAVAALHQGATGWPGWKIHRPGSALPSPAYCFVSVIVWTENKNVTISDGLNFFWGKKCIQVTWLEDFLTSKWPGSFTALAPPLRVVRVNTPNF